MSEKRTIELSPEQASFIDAKIAAGEFESPEQAVAAGIQNLQDHDAMIERWLQEEVIPSYDRWVADGKPTLSEDEVFESVERAISEAATRKAS